MKTLTPLRYTAYAFWAVSTVKEDNTLNVMAWLLFGLSHIPRRPVDHGSALRSSA